jgi:hypothetical protein
MVASTRETAPSAPPQSFSAIPATQYAVITLEYDPETGLSWADMWDNEVLSWVIDQSGAVPPQPVVLGGMQAKPATTDPVASPPWVAITAHGAQAIIPNLWRGDLNGLFTFLATNNDVTRKLRGNFLRAEIDNAWRVWSAGNPALVWDGTK